MPEAMDLRAEVLEGRFVRLEPYAAHLKDELRAALNCDADAWSLLGTSGQGERFEDWWSSALDNMASGSWISFAVRRLSEGRVVGASSYIDIRTAHGVVEIGATFLHPDVRSSMINPEAKQLMLAHAFEAGAHRVEILTDMRNQRSQAAIAKLGAVREGVLRRHKVTWTGHIRDTVMFAIIDLDWPEVRDRLDARLRT
ncbi:MAG: GNAT family protein [Caulobacteraceae bacterium]